MKTSSVLASLLFGSFAAAAPFDKRALVYATEIVTETVVVYTTVWDDEPEATTTAAATSYQVPITSAVVEAVSSAAPASSAAPVAPVVESSSIYTPAPTSTPAPVVESSSAAPVPTSTTVSVAASQVASSAAPAATSSSPSSSSGSSGSYSGDLTIYDNNGGYGACGTQLYDTDYIVALSTDAWGVSTYDTQTGAATNPWCGQKIEIYYNGNSVQATIQDMCPGCSGDDIDLSLATWNELTGSMAPTRLTGTWSKV